MEVTLNHIRQILIKNSNSAAPACKFTALALEI
jgi:hypothetical protein